MPLGWKPVSSPYVRVTVEYCWNKGNTTETAVQVVCRLSVRWMFREVLEALGKLYGVHISEREARRLQEKAEEAYREASSDPSKRFHRKLRASLRQKIPGSVGQAAKVLPAFGPEAISEADSD